MTRVGPCGPILVVDDDEALLELLGVLLRESGHAVTAVRTGADAVRRGEAEQPALAILDVCLPDVSGYEVCRRLRERWGNAVPILFVSGERTDTVDRVAGLLLGGDDYLVKPFAPDELLARVASLLRRSEQPENVHVKHSTLTPREHEVLQLIARGLPNAVIAKQLVISPKTVGTHIEHIYEKLGVRSRVGALRAGIRHELLTESPD